MNKDGFEYKVVQGTTTTDFERECEKAHEEDFMFIGQMVITGLGQGNFMYSQQWVKKYGEKPNMKAKAQ